MRPTGVCLEEEEEDEEERHVPEISWFAIYFHLKLPEIVIAMDTPLAGQTQIRGSLVQSLAFESYMIIRM